MIILNAISESDEYFIKASIAQKLINIEPTSVGLGKGWIHFLVNVQGALGAKIIASEKIHNKLDFKNRPSTAEYFC